MLGVRPPASTASSVPPFESSFKHYSDESAVGPEVINVTSATLVGNGGNGGNGTIPRSTLRYNYLQ